MTFDQIIGQNIRDLRNSFGISQSKLGDMLTTKVSYQQMQKYEKGVNRISAQTLLEFALALQVPLIAFYKGIRLDQAELLCTSDWIDKKYNNKSVSIAVTNLAEIMKTIKVKSNS